MTAVPLTQAQYRRYLTVCEVWTADRYVTSTVLAVRWGVSKSTVMVWLRELRRLGLVGFDDDVRGSIRPTHLPVGAR